jgi:hypothetical protein
MPTEIDYSKSKIYKIEVQNGDVECDTVYIGSTTKELGHRMNIHKCNYKNWKSGKTNKLMSYELFDDFGVENCKIDLIELFPCDTKEDLLERECYYQKLYKCNNKCMAGRTKKQYREDNKETIKQQKNLKYICLCGSSYSHCNLSQHNKTKKHQTYINK